MTDRPKFEDYIIGQHLTHMASSDVREHRNTWKLCASKYEPIIAGLEKQLAEAQRMFDLVRYMRSELHAKELISDEEYAVLSQDHPAVKRLESYDEMKKQLAEARAEVAGAFVAAANICSAHSYANLILALTPEHARQAMEQRIAEAVPKFSVLDMVEALEYAAEGRTNSVKPDLLGNYLNKLIARRVEANRAKAEVKNEHSDRR